VKTPRRLLSTASQLQHDLLSKATRNIGIIAHIDAVGQPRKLHRMHAKYLIGQDDHDGAHALLQWGDKADRKYV
jgi:hypothetical protein